MKKRIAINGFGRIGRLAARKLIQMSDIEIVAINDLTDVTTLAHLFQYDTAHRKFEGKLSISDSCLIIDQQAVRAFNSKDPAQLPWRELGVDLVLECTGMHLDKESAGAHIGAGAKRVLISAPAKDDSIPTFVIGVNEHQILPHHQILSNASCTTNCLSLLIKVIDEAWSIQFATMNTIHAFTQDQRLQDAPHKDLRRARAASMNVVPTSTGATKAVEIVYPAVRGKLMASSYRVPVITGSLIELVCQVNVEVSRQQVNDTFKEVSKNSLSGIVEYIEAPLVSSDIIGNTHSAIFDALLTEAKGRYVKVVAWYDNEAGYASRLADMCRIISKL